MDSDCRLDYEKIGDRIRECRKEKNLTQEALAELLYVSSNTISAIENGNHIFKIDKLSQLARAFEVTTDYLLYGKVESTYHEKSDENAINQLMAEASRLPDSELLMLIANLAASRKSA